MATKSFLTADEMNEAEAKLLPPLRVPDGDEKKIEDLGSLAFSNWLGERLQNRLAAHPDWEATGPVVLGSWARGELSPKSDIDLLFCGSEEAVGRLVQDFARQGLKLRYRMPEDPEDWTKGVLSFDILALLSAVPLNDFAEKKWRAQVDRLKLELKDKRSDLRKNLLKAMVNERKARADRYDSISNFLEPNLKFGHGGLRDLEQALVTRELFPERFAGDFASDSVNSFAGKEHAFDVLLYYKRLLLMVRQRLHLSSGGGEILSAPEQKPISDWLGFQDPRDFMREIQKGVSRVSFYADWVLEQASRPAARIRKVESEPLKDVEDLFHALSEDSSLLMQNHVRLVADGIFRQAMKKKSEVDELNRLIGRSLTQFLDPSQPEGAMVALFRSRLIDQCVPEFRKIVGYVQHDQYHRFSCDAHILQALREVKRIRRTPRLAGKLASSVKALNKREWEILAFSALYHDIAKGRGGDHSTKGIAIARHDLERFGKDAAFIKEVCWIVEEHLALSAAAFRENPRSPRTWRTLADKGVRGRRIPLLAVFTIVDIRATNPEAWTPWKERLLHELVAQLERPEADSMILFTDALKAAGVKGEFEKLVETLDPFLVGSVPVKPLLQDMKVLARAHSKRHELAPLIVRVRGGKQTWVRFHSAEDRAGLFLNYVSQLAAAGLGVRHASIHTDPLLGVYDWFEVKTSKTAAQIKKILSSAHEPKERSYRVIFDSIETVSSDDDEWIISFRGKDQSGALTEAARALFEIGAQIRWAKVHTWGRQIDDVFGVVPLGEREGIRSSDELIARLNAKLVAGQV